MHDVVSIKATARNSDEEEGEKLSFEEQVIQVKAERKALQEQQEIDIEAAKEDGRRQGYEAGFENGVIEGIEHSKKVNQKNVDGMVAVISNLEEELEKKSSEISKIVAIAIANALKSSYFMNINMDNESILKVVEASLNTLPHYAKNIRLKVSKEDYKIIKEAQHEMTIRVSDDLIRGEVKIETDVNVVSITSSEICDNAVKQILENAD